MSSRLQSIPHSAAAIVHQLMPKAISSQAPVPVLLRREMMPRSREGSAVSWSDGNRTGLWLYFVSIAEADANEPIDHQGEWQQREYGQKDGAAQESGKDLLLAKEEGACSEEESEAHSP
jgi:hypothetical protein